MTQENFEILMEIALWRSPFRVFTIELANGKRLEIDHSQALTFVEGLIQFVAPGKIGVWFDHESVLRVIQSGADTDV